MRLPMPVSVSAVFQNPHFGELSPAGAAQFRAAAAAGRDLNGCARKAGSARSVSFLGPRRKAKGAGRKGKVDGIGSRSRRMKIDATPTLCPLPRAAH